MHQGGAVVPRHVLRRIDHVVAKEGAHRQEADVFESKFGCEVCVVGSNLFKPLFTPVHNVHLVDGDHHVLDAQKTNDVRVPPCLNLDPMSCVDQNDCEVTGRGARGHVSGVLLVTRAVGNDELAFAGAEVPIGHIDGDALFTFTFESIHQKRKVRLFTRGTALDAVAGDGLKLVFVDHFGVVQKASNERALAIINTAAREETQELFPFMLLQVGNDVAFDQVGLVAH